MLTRRALRCCRIVFHAGSPAERQLFRTDFRFAPSPRCASLAGPPIHEGHGRPRSVRKSSRLRCKSFSMDCICSDIANLSTHLYRLPTPPPYLRRMRLSHGQGCRYPIGNKALAWPGFRCWVLNDAVSSQGRRCWVVNDAAGCPWHSSCKSPRTRILVLGSSGAHWRARWPQFVLTEHGSKS